MRVFACPLCRSFGCLTVAGGSINSQRLCSRAVACTCAIPRYRRYAVMTRLSGSPCEKGAAGALFTLCGGRETLFVRLSRPSAFFGSCRATGTPAFGRVARSGGCTAAAGAGVGAGSRACAGGRRARSRSCCGRVCGTQPRVRSTGRRPRPCGARFGCTRGGWRPTGLVRRARSGLCSLCRYAADGKCERACCQRQCELPHRFLSRPVVIGSATRRWD